MPLDAAGVVQIAYDEGSPARDDTAELTRSLILRAQAGETYAFEQLMTCYQKRVLCTAARILHKSEDAKDAAQEVFLKLYQYLPRIKPEAVRAWLYRVTVNVCRDMARKSKKRWEAAREDIFIEEESSVADAERVEASIDLEKQRGILYRALQSLPFKERAALVLRDVEGLSTEETAQVLRSSATTVRSQISTARAKVRRYCERAFGRAR
jgi:RNA polymerase sigma-70 factor (ECF subfamily)